MPGITDEISTLSEHLERFRGVTLQTLDLVPDDKLPWRPAEGLWSFAQQFLHIAQTEDFYAQGFFSGDWDLGRFAPPAGPLTREMVKEKLRETRAFTLDPARLDSIATVPNIPVQWSLRSWLWYLVEHEVHHKAQLALYLRQIGVTPPFFAYVLPPGVRPDMR